jgi:hypothetical protein
MPDNGTPPPITDVTLRIEVLSRSDARHDMVAHDQLTALAALIQSQMEDC